MSPISLSKLTVLLTLLSLLLYLRNACLALYDSEFSFLINFPSSVISNCLCESILKNVDVSCGRYATSLRNLFHLTFKGCSI